MISAVVNRQMAAGALTVAASSRADNKVLGQGTLLLINNEIDQTTGTIQLKATFPNKDHALWPGQFVDVQLLVETRHNAVTVPAAAVQLGPQGVYAYVVKAGNRSQMVPIKVSTRQCRRPYGADRVRTFRRRPGRDRRPVEASPRCERQAGRANTCRRAGARDRVANGRVATASSQ